MNRKPIDFSKLLTGVALVKTLAKGPDCSVEQEGACFILERDSDAEQANALFEKGHLLKKAFNPL